MRTMNNMLGDCYAAAVIEKISQNDLDGIKEVHIDIPMDEMV